MRWLVGYNAHWWAPALLTGSRIAHHFDLALEPLSEGQGLKLPVALFSLCLGVVGMFLVHGVQHLVSWAGVGLKRRRGEMGNTEVAESGEAREGKDVE